MKLVLIVLFSLCSFTTSVGQSIGLKLYDSVLQWRPFPVSYFKLSGIPGTQPLLENKKSLAFTSPYNHRDQLGFVCKWELKMDVKTKNPVRFRLGSYDYVNKLEGK